MPRIKFPINQAERDHNKRYERDTQIHYLSEIDKGLKIENNLDALDKDFLRNMNWFMARNRTLTEFQADKLFRLYERCSR